MLQQPSRSSASRQEGHPSSSVGTTGKGSCLSSFVISPLVLKQLEEHDEAIAAIARSTSSSAPCVCRDDLRPISLIGTGRFCKVYTASGPSSLISNDYKYCSNSNNNSSSCPNTNPTRNGTTNEQQQRRPPSLVAVKSIDLSRVQDAEELAIAAGELANEVKILSKLDHENIVRLLGICSESFSKSFGREGYFLVLEVLRETLCDRLQKWRRQKQRKERAYRQSRKNSHRRLDQFQSCFPNYQSHASLVAPCDIEPEPEERRRRMHQRIKETVLGIANGLDYLHSNGIVLRDLKPANIGYETPGVEYGSANFDRIDDESSDAANTVRLFDFGMAQKVELCDPLESCGTLRYMAPEAIAGTGYSLKVDVYSFGVVLYEICSLCHPFAKNHKTLFTRTKQLRQRQRAIFRQLSSLLRRSPKVPREGAETKHQLVKTFCDQILSGEVVPASNLEQSVCCPELRSLIVDCWAFDAHDRPDFPEILSRLASIFSEGVML